MTIVIVVDAAQVVRLDCSAAMLFPDHGVVDFQDVDQDGAPIGGRRVLFIDDSMRLEHVEELPEPWVLGAYHYAFGSFVLDEESEAWQTFEAERVAALAAAKEAKNLAINQWRAAANGTTFPYLGKHVQCDLTSTIDLMGTANQIALHGKFPPDFPGAWKAHDNTFIPLPTVDDFKALYEAFTQRGSLNFLHAQELKAATAAAVSQAQLDAIKW